MALFVGNHLDSVLNIAQIPIALRQLVSCFGSNPAIRGKGVQPSNRANLPEICISATSDQLLRLDKKFNLPDPAATKLYVVAFDSDLTVPPMLSLIHISEPTRRTPIS